MKNKKPLQFVKKLPSYVDLWRIIDETIEHPMEGLSVEELKYYFYVYLRTNIFTNVKSMLQSNLIIEEVQIVKQFITSKKTNITLRYKELLPEVEGLPQDLIYSIFLLRLNEKILPEDAIQKLTKLKSLINTGLPDLSTLSHTGDIKEITSKRELELDIYKRVLKSSSLPKYIKLSTDTENTQDWIEWNGGDCPVNADDIVRVQLRNDTEHTTKAGTWVWRHASGSGDIVKYKVIKEA